MDIRNELVDKFKLLGGKDVEILIMALSDYEITKRVTEIIVPDDSCTVVLKKYLATKMVEGRSEKTISRYRYIIGSMLNFINLPINEISAYNIRLYMAEKKMHGTGDRTLEGERKIYSSFFRWACDENFIDENPCKNLGKIKFKQEQKKPYTDVELTKIMDCCENERDLAIVQFLYDTGCRISEMIALDIDNVDFRNKSVTVLGKGNKVRKVYLTDKAILRLTEYLETRNDKVAALFVGKGNKRLEDNGVRVMLKKVGVNAGIDNVHPHRFRRTKATDLLNHGMAIQDVSRLLGHSDLATTQIYCYMDDKDTEYAYHKYS